MSEVKTNKISSLASNNDITLDPDGTGDVVVASGHKLGIGTASPASLMHIDQGSGGEGLRFERDSYDTMDIELSESGLRVRNETDSRTDFFINGSGNVGVGTSNPSGKLHAQMTHTSTDVTAANSNETLVLGNSGAGNGIYNAIRFGGNQQDMYIMSFNNNTKAGRRLGFFVGSVAGDAVDDERLSIIGNGDVTIGNYDDNGATGGLLIEAGATEYALRTSTTLTSSRIHYDFRNTNGRVGSIATSGSSTSYNESSDHRLKENVVDLTGAITRVKSLAPKRFNFIADDSVTVDGFIAHEAQAVVPEAVTGTHNEVDDDGNAVMQGIDKGKLVPLLTAALQEAITKIETLETEMTALKARVTALENA